MMSDNEQTNKKIETVADILEEMRGMGNYQRYSGDHVRALADRIDAAWKRDEERAVEHATRHAEAVARDNCRDCVHNPKGKNYEGGNAAEIREALVKVIDNIDLWKTGGIIEHWQYSRLFGIANAAISASARNCDRFSEKGKALEAFEIETGRDYSLYAEGSYEDWWEFVHWLFAPSAERKGEGDGNL